MNTGILELLSIGIPVIVLGFLSLSLMVHKELGPFVGLGPGGKWMLTLALGMGILAFTLKMSVALMISKVPENTVDPLVAAEISGLGPNPGIAGEMHNPAPVVPGHYVWETLPEFPPAPANNPLTAARIALGKRLFDENRLSGDGSLTCSSCHNLFEKAGGDARPTAKGIHGQIGPRNSPTLWNAAFQSVLFWDGRAPSLEEQARGPILNPVEMGLASGEEAERRLSADGSYRDGFTRAFGDEKITFERILQAIASYERTLITADSPYDRFVRGDSNALTQTQKRGMALFESVGCILCHRGPNFSDASLLGGQSPLRFFPANATSYEQKYDLLTEDGKRGQWRVPSLRNVALTGPWLHNGSVDELEEVVRIMASAQLGRSENFISWLNPDNSLGKVERTPLSQREVTDIVAFLNALSSTSLLARMETRQ